MALEIQQREREGITVLTGARCRAASRAPDGAVSATLEGGRTFTGDEILVAVGRRARTADLGLDTVGLTDFIGKSLAVDDRLRVQGGGGRFESSVYRLA